MHRRIAGSLWLLLADSHLYGVFSVYTAYCCTSTSTIYVLRGAEYIEFAAAGAAGGLIRYLMSLSLHLHLHLSLFSQHQLQVVSASAQHQPSISIRLARLVSLLSVDVGLPQKSPGAPRESLRHPAS